MFFYLHENDCDFLFCKTKKIHDNSLHYVLGKTCEFCTDLNLNDTCNGFNLVIIHAYLSMKKVGPLILLLLLHYQPTCVAFTGSALHPEVFPAPGTLEGPFTELYSLHSMPQLGTI